MKKILAWFADLLERLRRPRPRLQLEREAPIKVAPVPFVCLNGPAQGATVEAPADATPGTACAIPWATVKGEPRYAVYVLVDWNGAQGLMYLRSHQRPEYAQSHVQRLTLLCAAEMA